MFIKIDCRESKLLELLSIDPLIPIIKEQLPLGDIIIGDGEKELLIIERKTLDDLAASIKDGRYLEQSFRLQHCEVPNHNIIYLIEGTKYNIKKANIPVKTIHSSLFALNYFKGFSVKETKTIQDTANYIIHIFGLLKREKEKRGFYNGNDKMPDYCDVMKKTKKSYITPENIGTIMLSQIPGVSSVTAKAIMANYTTFDEFMNCDINNLYNIMLTSKSGKKRRISKKSVENIKLFLYR